MSHLKVLLQNVRHSLKIKLYLNCEPIVSAKVNGWNFYNVFSLSSRPVSWATASQAATVWLKHGLKRRLRMTFWVRTSAPNFSHLWIATVRLIRQTHGTDAAENLLKLQSVPWMNADRDSKTGSRISKRMYSMQLHALQRVYGAWQNNNKGDLTGQRTGGG